MAMAPTAVRQDKYSFERETVGGITFVTMHGTLNETFEGRKLATAIRSKKVILNMFDVRRFASWGMSEWMDFVRVTAESDLYLVECSTYAVSQLNLVTGLLGHAKLVSFYASYRCGTCSEEMQTLFLIPRDHQLIPDIPGSQRDCVTCGGRARLEEYPAAFFDTIAQRPLFDIDDEALAFMRGRLHYDLSADLARFRAYRKVQKSYTYIRLTGNVAALPPEALTRATANTTVLDLENVVFDPNQLTTWRTYLDAAVQKASSLQLLACPVEFIETAIRPEDLRGKLKIRSFYVNYECGTCQTVASHEIDVALNLEVLVTGVLPSARCPSCRSTLLPPIDDERAMVLRALPARERDVALDALITKAKAEPVDKLDNCLAAQPTAEPKAPSRVRTWALAAVGVLLIGALGGFAYRMLSKEETTKTPLTVIAPTPPPKPSFQRPEWIIADVPASGYCHDMINRLMCVGVSSFRKSRDDGAVEATDAALEELVNSVGLKITEPVFRDMIERGYSTVRSKALSSLDAATLNRTTDAKGAATYATADEVVRTARHRVVDVLRSTAGAAAPAQRSDWYWEEYAGEGSSTEFLVFVRFDISLDAVRALVDKYSTAVTIPSGTTAITAFPGIAWERPEFKGGAMLTKVDDKLVHAGIGPRDVILQIDADPILDASSFSHRVEKVGHADLKMKVATSGAADKSVVVRW